VIVRNNWEKAVASSEKNPMWVLGLAGRLALILYFNQKQEWVFTCESLGFFSERMTSKDLADAKIEALAKAHATVRSYEDIVRGAAINEGLEIRLRKGVRDYVRALFPKRS